MNRIISLTSIPPRFKYLESTLASLLNQNSKSEIRVNIPKSYRRFPDWDKKIPKFDSKINIVRCEEDLGPATKILPTALDHHNEDLQILFCDDDGIHPRNWAINLFNFHLSRPNEAVATWGRHIVEIPNVELDDTIKYTKLQNLKYDFRYRFGNVLNKIINIKPLYRPVRKAGYAQLLLGVGGVVVKPKFFNESSLDIPDVAFLVDDIWLSAQLAKNGTKIYCPARFPVPLANDGEKVESLYDMTVGGGRRRLNYNALIWCRNNLNVW